MHKNKFILDYARKNGVILDMFLPHYSTDWVQIGDLYYNGPVKADAREIRAENLFDCYEGWQLQSLTQQRDDPWTPPLARCS